MKTNRLLLCTDMDRTIIPNGHQAEHPKALLRFTQLCKLPSVMLVYVTGRHLELVERAIADYDLPHPEYAITDVGTKIYHRVQNNWEEISLWQDTIAQDWPSSTRKHLQEALKDISSLTLQEPSKQSDFKLSYSLPISVDQEQILIDVKQQLTTRGEVANLIVSVDDAKNLLLLDILPPNATKLHAIQFLQQHLGYRVKDTIFAGDSGNDLPVLGSEIRSILVANAEPGFKQKVKDIAQTNGYPERLYIAKGNDSAVDGNYSAGVLQGVLFFMPELQKELHLS
jgi:sucrose-6-phosphatase